MDDELFSQDEFENTVVEQFERIISECSPARDADSVPREIKSHGRVISPFPGNLKLNGNVRLKTSDGFVVKHGYAPAPYALFANKMSRKPNYIQKAVQKFSGFLESDGWEEV